MYQYLKPYFLARTAYVAGLGYIGLKLYSPPYDRVFWNSNIKRL